MIDPSLEAFIDYWRPVSRSEELAPRHVAQSQLLGQEIALWRADDGVVNAWENRCPHRGVRLSIGINTGQALKCQYHAWRFSSGDGRCAFIPAHASLPPPQAIGVKTYAAAERDGFVWVCLGAAGPPTFAPFSDDLAGLTQRSVFVEAPFSRVAAHLAADYSFAPDVGVAPDAAPMAARMTRLDPLNLEAVAMANGVEARMRLMLQPVSEGRTVIHATLSAPIEVARRLAVLRHHSVRLGAVRDAAQAADTRV